MLYDVTCHHKLPLCFQNKKDYLTEVGQRLLKDLREDADAVSAVTHVEVEIIEDVTNILKTYVIGERADDYLEEQMIDAIHYEEHVDRTPSPIEQMKVEKIYVDTLTVEDRSHELEKAEINLLKEGRHFEGEGALKRVRRLESDESDVIISKTRCANVGADCCLAKREDSSTFTVYIAIPLIQTISMILTRRRAQKHEQFSRSIATTQSGQQFESESSLRQSKQVETIVDERKKLIQHGENDLPVARVQEVLAQRSEKETEADGRKYEMELRGQKLVGDIVIKRRERAVDSESSEELPLTKTMIIKEREAQGGQYAMEIHGVTLRGEKTFHREGRVYESESEESIQWNRGSPTTVDLIKKESHSFFDVVFETSNIYEPQAISIKRAVVKRESCEVNSAFSLPKVNAEEVSIVMKTKLMWRENFFGRELSEQYSYVTISLQNLAKPEEKENGVEQNLAAITHVKVECSLREAMEEQMMMLYNFENTVPAIGEALVLRREKNRHGASFFTAAAEFEYITLNSLLSHSGEMLGFESSLKTPNTIRNAVKLKEMSLEHATSVIYLHKTPGIQDQYADTVARDKHVGSDFLRTRAASDSCLIAQYALKKQSSFPSDIVVQANIKTANRSSSSFRSWASESRIINATLMLSKGAVTQTAAIKISDRNRQETTTHVAEYGHDQQHCAVMLKNTGGAHGSTSAALAEAVTGGFLIDVDTRTTNKSFHLTNYKTMLPPCGETQIAWPQATLISASFLLSKLSEQQKLHDENFHQDMRIRRKDDTADVTVYFLYKRVLGNFAMAALGIYVGERIRQIREQQLSKEVVDTSERFERHTRQVECRDEFAPIARTTTVEDDTTGKHLLHEMQLTALMCLSSTVLMYSKAYVVQRSLLNLHARRICPPLQKLPLRKV
ncbi:unnamed protein product [Angiostrongylus costaricensis]|uniref:LysM domain-containing protein n=1 Tax=Angiostrongylus costaricensis TaxID=334426 RepID=A0A0R3PWG8_ANGCS|nr:unnamed protein product [Angiostrongylus costaricensis]